MGYSAMIGAFLPVMLISIFMIAVLLLLKSPWFKGFAGEILVHISAKINLDNHKYHVLRNVTFPTTDGTTQIDHIIVSRYGVFVVETKNMKGWIFGGAHQRMWTQKIYTYSNKFQNPLHQNHKRVETLKSALELNDQQIFSIVVFVGPSAFKTDMPENVIDGSGLIRFIKSKDQQVMLDHDVQMILAKIEAERLVPSRDTSTAHIKHVRQRLDEKKNGCSGPRCKSPMVVDAAKIGPDHGDNFLGGTPFPHCKGAAPFSSSDDGWDQECEFEPPFTDSWENRSWQSEDTPSEFKDRVFQ